MKENDYNPIIEYIESRNRKAKIMVYGFYFSIVGALLLGMITFFL